MQRGIEMSDTKDLARKAMEMSEKATPGPWIRQGGTPPAVVTGANQYHESFPEKRKLMDGDNHYGWYVNICRGSDTNPDWQGEWNDMDFIAFARTALPELAQAVLSSPIEAALRAELEQAKAELDALLAQADQATQVHPATQAELQAYADKANAEIRAELEQAKAEQDALKLAIEDSQKTINEWIERADNYKDRCVDLESRLDLGTGNMYDVVCVENERLRAELERAREALNGLVVLIDAGNWGNNQLTLRLKAARAALDGSNG